MGDYCLIGDDIIDRLDEQMLKLPHYSCEAMACEFEITIAGCDRETALGAAMEGFEIVEQLEQRLSRFVEGSDVSQINTLTAGKCIVIGDDAIACLQIAREIYDSTGGAFDITFGSERDASWDDYITQVGEVCYGKSGVMRSLSGMDLLVVDEDNFGVGVLANGIRVDLGGIGKGYAVDCIVGMLKEWGIDSAMVSGGGSTIYAYGEVSAVRELTGKAGWPVTISAPANPGELLRCILLNDKAISASGVYRKGGHIVNPYSKQRIVEGKACWAIADDAVRVDALSTAFMIMELGDVSAYCKRYGVTAAIFVDKGKILWINEP